MDKKWFQSNVHKIANFCKKHHIDSFSLFGSILGSHFNEASDVDILVNFEKNHIPDFFTLADMETELELLIGRKVDLKTPEDLSPYFRNEVLSNAELIYAA